MKRVLAIACGLKEPKKDYSFISKRNLYLNYGLLGLCTILKKSGYIIKQFQGEYLSVNELVDIINQSDFRLDQIKFPVIISIVSFLSLPWCQELTALLKQKYNLTCVLGGKYVIDGNVEWLKRKLPYVDYFIEGSGENKIEKVITTGIVTDNEVSVCYDSIDFSLLHEYEKYNPIVELARGCGRGCVYCADGNRKVTKRKDADSVIDELHELKNLYNQEFFCVYYQMATFSASEEWIEKYKKRIDEFEQIIPWRCTTRIETLFASDIPKLAQIGMKVVDLGLESASPRQLRRMKKTEEPENYLKKAEEAIHIAYENGVWIKLNLLLTAGENTDTITETKEWLEKNKKYIKGASANCETIYGPNNTIIEELKKYGAKYIDENELEQKGYCSINLSEEMDHEQAVEIAKELSKIVMTADDYFELKKYGYFSRYYEYDAFLSDIQNIPEEQLPFRKEG